MKQPRTPTNQRLASSRDSKKGRDAPRTPTAQRLAPSSGQASSADATATAGGATNGGPSRAWKTGGDRKIMFENKGGHENALVPELTRPKPHIAVLSFCAWCLLAAGGFQVVVSKLSNFHWPLHWVGVLLMLLALTTMGVRIYAGRCGTAPECVLVIALLAVGGCLTSWLACEGPLYADVKAAVDCTERETSACPSSNCSCSPDEGNKAICVDFRGSCEDIPSNRRYLVMSLLSLWVSIGLAAIVGVVSLMMITGCGDTRETALASAASAQKWGKTGLELGTNASARHMETSTTEA